MAIHRQVMEDRKNEKNVKTINFPGYKDPMYVQTTHEGLVLEKSEHNGYDDSDFYAIVWNAELNKTEEVIYATTRGWTYANSAEVDATPEILKAYADWQEEGIKKARQARLEEEARLIRHGKEVKVVRGRKVPIGTEGRVFWYGANQWGMSVGIETRKGERLFTSEKNVEVVI